MFNQPMADERTGKPLTSSQIFRRSTSPNRRKWVGNGNGYDPNEHLLLGQRVVFVAGGRIQGIGILKMIPAATRGNTTLAVVWKQLRGDGKTVRRSACIWEHRNKRGEFSIELADDYQHEQAEWLKHRQVVS